MNKPIVWVHGDCLSPYNPVLQKYPDAPAIWVWDEALIEEWQLSLKRIAFIYECLLELPVVIRRGDVAQEILAFAKEHDANLVVTANSPSPRFDDICNQMERSLAVQVLEVEPFFNYDGYIDLKRFSRYWKVAQNYVFRSSLSLSDSERDGFA
ncbi:MAG: hypothetical protein V7L00_21540 [Nostoc sp.]|uniref:hypothetical protein n=1 Tax=Nostoc sp. TaxID=1180 RepID=UPI002FF7E595